MRKIAYDGVIVRSKLDSWMMLIIAAIIYPFNKRFLTNYWTTMFGKIYAPSSANMDNLANHDGVIQHEKIHLLDAKKWKVWFGISYLFLPLPIFLCYGRWYWERKAYLPELMKIKDTWRFPGRLNSIVNSLGGSNYLWAWPKKWIREWFLKKIYPEKNVPYDKLKKGLLAEKTIGQTGGVRMGRGYDTNGKTGMRQL